jgi:hypothetical protein
MEQSKNAQQEQMEFRRVGAREDKEARILEDF